MGRFRKSQIFLNIACCALILLTADFRPLLAGSLLKLIASLAFACLLAFVVVHSANVCQLVISSLSALSKSLFPFAIDRRWSLKTPIAIVVPDEPSLSSLFQRPPPFLL